MKLVSIIYIFNIFIILYPGLSFTQIKNNSDPKKRSSAFFQLLLNIYDGEHSQQEKIKVVDKVVEALLDESPGIRNTFTKKLLYVDKSLFSNSSLQIVKKAFDSSDLVNYYTILLAGNLDLSNMKDRLNDFIQRDSSDQFETSISYRSMSWAAHLTLAKMGTSKNMDFLLAFVDSEPHISNVYFDLIGDLAFTGQKPAIDFIVEKMFSDEGHNYTPYEEPLKTTSQPFALQTLPILATLVKDIPIRKSEAYGMKDLRIARAWFTRNSRKYKLKEGSNYIPRF